MLSTRGNSAPVTSINSSHLLNPDASLDANSGSEDDVIASPKLTFVFGPWKKTELYLNIGTGFHSNDARGATLSVDPVSGESASPVDLLVRAESLWTGVCSTWNQAFWILPVVIEGCYNKEMPG